MIAEEKDVQITRICEVDGCKGGKRKNPVKTRSRMNKLGRMR